MSDTPDDGGSAFPTRSDVDPRGETVWGEAGMTLRDYFAIHATEFDVRNGLEDLGGSASLRAAQNFSSAASGMERNAAARYAFADAMLKARKK